MKVDGFYVVGHDTPGGDAVFMQTYMVCGLPSRHWGVLEFADRFLMFKDAKKAADNAPCRRESDGPAAVWRVDVTATKET